MAAQVREARDKPAEALPEPPKPEFQVDRQTVCPLLLRVFPQFGGHHRIAEFAKELPHNELMMYTWEDATLRELTDLIKSAQPAAKRGNARLEFALVYPDKKGRNVMRQVGVTNSTRPGPDDLKTLKSIQFQTGDYMDVAIM